MACGVGICQGCPVENTGGDKKYSLICKDGPVFNSKSIVLT
jgi:dihydroorotate dehydrogenase electron transfer subunit